MCGTAEGDKVVVGDDDGDPGEPIGIEGRRNGGGRLGRLYEDRGRNVPSVACIGCLGGRSWRLC